MLLLRGKMDYIFSIMKAGDRQNTIDKRLKTKDVGVLDRGAGWL